METQHMTKDKMKSIYQESEQLYQNISSAAREISEIHKRAKNEIQYLKKEIADDEIKANGFRMANDPKIIEKTDIYLDEHSKAKQKGILLELYLAQNYQDMIASLKDTASIKEYQTARKDFPKAIQLQTLIWRFTGKKKKEKLLRAIEKVNLFNYKYRELNREIEKELEPSLALSTDQLWKDFDQNEESYYAELKEIHKTDKAKISKEDYLAYKKAYKKFLHFQKQAEPTFQKRNASSTHVKYLISKANQEQVDDELKKTSLDEFSQLYPDSRLKLQLLAQEGIRTVEEMNQYPSFLQISGVGEVTNQHLQSALDHYKEEVNQSIGFHFEPESKTNNQTEILRNLYTQVNYKELNNEMKQLQLWYYQMPYDSMLQDVFLRSEWAMQQLAKNETMLAEHNQKMKKLSDFVERHTPTVMEYSKVVKNISKLTREEIWSNFNAHAADYYAILEREFGIGSANVEDTIKRSGLSDEIIQKIKDFDLNEQGLSATLRSWQDFGTKYSLVQKKVLIGDEMGLGKTLISIAAMTHLTAAEEQNRFLVICPASIMTNWERELDKFSKIKVYRAHGNYREAILETWKQTGGVAITTYETSQVLDFSDVDKIDMLTVDEAHYIKNPDAKRTKGVRELTNKSEYALYLTGTPLENKVQEMTEIIKPLESAIAQELKRPRMTIQANEYRKKIAPVYLRRTKKDVALELPPLTQVEEWEEFGDEEFEEYKDAVANGKFMRMRRAAWTGSSSHNSPKLKRLLELAEEAYENNNKVIVFTFFRDVIETVVDALGERVVEPIHGGVPIGQRQEIIDEFRDSSTKNVLVAQINTAAHGLNIQFANTIIFCEPQIKPSLESQAVARAYRMGQVDNVFVYRLLTVNSIDELMMDMLGNKQALFDEFADRSYLQEEVEGIEETEDQETENIQSKIIDLESARLGVKKEVDRKELKENKRVEN